MRLAVGLDGRLVGPALPERPANRGDQRLAILRVDGDADPAVGNGVGAAAADAADDAQPAGRGLEVDDAEALERARHHEQVGEAVEARQFLLRYVAQEADRRRIARQFPGALLEAGAIVA